MEKKTCSESRHTNQLCSISKCDANSLLSEASLMPESTHIAKPAASWLDDFLVWMSPEAFGCCRKFVDGSYCPPDDQPPCCSPDEDSCDLDGVCKDCTTDDFVNSMHAAREFSSNVSNSLKVHKFNLQFCPGIFFCCYSSI
ncbi:hypothetical protein LOK49_LG06G00491 [Camellia lanceoleosa]|uniref:Uncharacterized protein n=1 Tax=Camellia lanceoleosa TaxID=1840588 RepID=A0ACC0HBU7_9ERIC|nr:hypothetical protein LOK49_LG06G00491 [Camellia lanceoleosa]